MTTRHSTAATLLVAIDISKHRHEVLIGVPGKKRRRRLTITNTLEDFQRLSTALAGYDLPVRIGFEATGNYHRPLAHHLGQAGFELKLVSSVGLAQTREALHNSWDKNGPKDAQVKRRTHATPTAALRLRVDEDCGAQHLRHDIRAALDDLQEQHRSPIRAAPVLLPISDGAFGQLFSVFAEHPIFAAIACPRDPC